MNKLKLLLVVFLFWTPLPIHAAEEEEGSDSDVVLSFPLTAQSTFLYEVKVSGNGVVYDGSQAIQNGVMEYDLPIEAVKTFRIEPDNGHVYEVYIDGVKQTISNDCVTIASVSKHKILEVQFRKQEETPNVPPEESVKKPDSSSQGSTSSSGNEQTNQNSTTTGLEEETSQEGSKDSNIKQEELMEQEELEEKESSGFFLDDNIRQYLVWLLLCLLILLYLVYRYMKSKKRRETPKL